MKISMWMLAYELQQFSFKADIKDSDMEIESISFFDTLPDYFMPQYAYLGNASDYFSSKDESGALILVHRYSYILLFPMPLEHAINRILRIFEKYQKWEADVRLACLPGNPYQSLADCCTEIFHNPVTISDPTGVLIGYTRSLEGWEPNEFWKDLIETGLLSRELLSLEQTDRSGRKTDEWTSRPTVYHSALNTCLGAHFELDGEYVGGFAISEVLQPLTERDIQLAERFMALVLDSGLFSRFDSQIMASDVMLRHVLEGEEPNPDSVDYFVKKINTPPWYLIQIRFLKRRSDTLNKNIIHACKACRITNTVVEYGNDLVILTAQGKEEPLLKKVIPTDDLKNYRIAISVPVDQFHQIPLALQQTQFALSEDSDTAEIVYCQSLAVRFFEKLLGNQGEEARMMVHPALRKLRDYDAKHKSDLYETLYVYLIHERNLVKTSQALFPHRNSLVWRVRRIQELTGLDLDDGELRKYLLYSYAVSGHSGEE